MAPLHSARQPPTGSISAVAWWRPRLDSGARQRNAQEADRRTSNRARRLGPAPAQHMPASTCSAGPRPHVPSAPAARRPSRRPLRPAPPAAPVGPTGRRPRPARSPGGTEDSESAEGQMGSADRSFSLLAVSLTHASSHHHQPSSSPLPLFRAASSAHPPSPSPAYIHSPSAPAAPLRVLLRLRLTHLLFFFSHSS